MTTIAAINNRLQNLLNQYPKLVGTVALKALLAKTQLRQLTKSKDNLKIGDKVEGIEVIGFLEEDEEGDKVALGRVTVDVPVFGPLLKTNYGSAALQSSGDFLYDITVPMTVPDVFNLFAVTLKSYFSVVMTDRQINLAAISVSEKMSNYNNAVGSSTVPLINQAGDELLDVSQTVLGRLKKKQPYILNDLMSDGNLANSISLSSLSENAPRNPIPIVNFSNDNSRLSLRTIEEIEAYLLTAVRDINQVIIGHSNTYMDQYVSYDSLKYRDVSVSSLDDVSCHFIITKEGQVIIARDINKVAPFAEAKHNDYSIAVMLEGGLIGETKSESTDKSKRSFTAAQFTALNIFLKAFYTIYPGGQVWGKNDLDQNTTEPEFSVTKYIDRVFDKQNTQSVTQVRDVGSLSTDDLIFSQKR